MFRNPRKRSKFAMLIFFFLFLPDFRVLYAFVIKDFKNWWVIFKLLGLLGHPNMKLGILVFVCFWILYLQYSIRILCCSTHLWVCLCAFLCKFTWMHSMFSVCRVDRFLEEAYLAVAFMWVFDFVIYYMRMGLLYSPIYCISFCFRLGTER